MEELVDAGKIKAIGLSNFLSHHLDNILEHCRIRPVVNQLELHVGYSQEAAVAYSQERGIQVQAWSPFARGVLEEHPLVGRMADKYGKSPAQVCLRFLYQKGIMPLIKASAKERMLQNLDVFDFTLEKRMCKCWNACPRTLGEESIRILPFPRQ